MRRHRGDATHRRSRGRARVSAPPVKYALDTNILIDAFRDPDAEAALLGFLERALPFTFLSAVVMQELAAGARTLAQFRGLERSVFQPFVRRGRVFAPMTAAFVESGRLLAALAAREGWPTDARSMRERQRGRGSH